MDWNDLAKTLAPTVVGFGLGTWNTGRVQRSADAKSARSALHGQGQELAAALAAYRVERNVHQAKYWTTQRKFVSLGMSFMAWAAAVWATPEGDKFSDRAVRGLPAAAESMGGWREKADHEERLVVDAMHHLFAACLPLAGSSYKAVADATQAFVELLRAEKPDSEVDVQLGVILAAIRQANAKPLRWWQRRKK